MVSSLIYVAAALSCRRLRTLVTGVGVAIAAGTLFCLLSFQRGYQRGLQAELDHLGAHLLVVPKGCPYDAASIALHGASWPCYLKSSYLDQVRRTPHVAVAAPVLMTALYYGNSAAQAVYCGVDADILQIKRDWRIQGRFPARRGELLVGSDLAHQNHWAIGEAVSLPGLAAAHGTVSGILQPTQGPDDLFIYLGLADAQRLFQRPDQLTHMLVRLDDPDEMDRVVGELRGCDAGLQMNVVPLAHLFQTIQNLVRSTRLLLDAIALVALLVAGAGVSNTILMAVVERTRELGVLRAVGASRGDIFALIWGETVALCLAGGMAGIAAAACGQRLVEAWLRGKLPFAPHGALIQVDGDLVAFCLAGIVAMGTLAALLPAWRAARLSPVEAMG